MAHHWNPMDQLQVSGPGQWFMFDRGLRIALIRELRLGPRKEVMYRVVTADENRANRSLIGYFPNLPMAVSVTWREWQHFNGRYDTKKPAESL